MPHYIYILLSEATEKYYCVEIKNLDDRLERHNSGRSKSTKSGMPWKLIRVVEVSNRSEGRKLELH